MNSALKFRKRKEIDYLNLMFRYMTRPACLLLLLSFVFGTGLSAQDCAVNLRNAEELFGAGRVEEVPALLESCLESGFTAAEELSAYKLIIRSYLFDDKTDMAEAMMLEFLKKNPEYEISPTDNTDFIYLFNKFNVKPVIQLGLKAGINYTYIMGKENLSVSGEAAGTDYKNENFTIALGGLVKYKINDFLEAGIELDYSETSFNNSEEFLSYGIVSYNEKQRRLESTVNVYYEPRDFNGFIPYFKAGAGVAYNISTTASSTFYNSDVNNPFERAGPEVNRVDSRNRSDILIAAGMGCKYKLPSGYVFFDLDTRAGLMNQSIPGVPADQELYYFFTDDRFRLNVMRASLGYIFIIYKPERIPE